jgi:hypothetical protein
LLPVTRISPSIPDSGLADAPLDPALFMKVPDFSVKHIQQADL